MFLLAVNIITNLVDILKKFNLQLLMINKIILFVAVIKSVIFVNRTDAYVALHLGEECKYDRECHQNDPNSYCSSYSQRYLCVCKNNYRVGIVNNTEKCVYSDFPEEEREGLTAAPIILCFLVCVLVEAFCLLAFRYWKKHRSGVTRHGALHMQTITLSEFTRFSHSRSDPVVSFTMSPDMESMISNTRISSPPPYSQTLIVGTHISAQREDPPPPYDEAIKQCITSSKLPSEEQSYRKMSF